MGVELPDVSKIPAVKFADIKEIVAEKYNHKMRNPFDLEPEEEVLIGRYAKESGEVILYLSHIILLRNVRSMQWMIRKIQDIH